MELKSGDEIEVRFATHDNVIWLSAIFIGKAKHGIIINRAGSIIIWNGAWRRKSNDKN